MQNLVKLHFGRKGQGMGAMGPRKPISLLLGIAFLAIGGVPLLNLLKVVDFTIPVLPQTILYVLSIIGAVILLWDAISENMAMMGVTQIVRMATFVMAIILLAIGLVPLLYSMGTIGFTLPALAGTIVNVLYVVTGGLLIYGGTQGF